MSLLGKILGGRYELLEKIGGGGMAVVYKAKCHLLKRYVAVKILRPELVENEEFVNRFKRESQSAASLSHPNIVNMYDVGQEGDIHYIVMEYVDGKTLKEYIHEKSRLESEEAVKIASQICSALNHAHNNNIVHRDIKPQNILISKDGTVKVADFGIARAVNSATVTMAGANVIGSVHYFSPEQARGGYVDKKSDIYSLGIVLYEMVTGVVPFEGDSAISVALKHIQEKVTPPGEINPDIPKSIQYIIERAIEKDLNKRYHDAAEMLSDLKRALKEPDGAYVKRAIDEDQATIVLPAIQGDPDSLQKDSTKEYKALNEDEEEETSDRRRSRVWMGVSIAVIATVLLVLFMVLRAIYIQNFVHPDTEVPLIEGYDEETAREILDDRNLVLNIVERRYDSEVPEGQIISQKPQQGMTVQAESAVDAVISSGIKKVPVPDVVNKSQRNAEIELENKGLKVAEPEYVNSEEPSGYVVDQDPPAKQEVDEGTEVTLVISKGPEDNTTKVGKYTGLTVGMAQELLESDNLKLGTVTEEPNDTVNPGIVFKQSPQPDMNVEKDRKVDLWVSKGESVSYEKLLKIIPEGNKGKIRVKVVRTSDDKVIYDKEHNASEGVIKIVLNDTGIQSYAIWINNEYEQTQTLDFTKKESEGE
jgi:serine/threonine-protein kinase